MKNNENHAFKKEELEQVGPRQKCPERARAPWGPKEGAQREKTGTIFIDGFPLISLMDIHQWILMDIQFFEIQFFEIRFFEIQFFEIQFFEKTMKNHKKITNRDDIFVHPENPQEIKNTSALDDRHFSNCW